MVNTNIFGYKKLQQTNHLVEGLQEEGGMMLFTIALHGYDGPIEYPWA